MSQRELLIVIAHAHQCATCRTRLLGEPERVFSGRALTDEEISVLSGLEIDDFITPERLASAAGVSAEEFAAFQEHPIVRLRHF